MTPLSLFELNNLVRSVLEQTLDDDYWVEAEIAEARLAQNGHFYLEFVQKDAEGRNVFARARAVMWARTYNLLSPLFERATGERLRAGIKVRVQVSVEFHELYGYTLNISDIDPSYTMGDLLRRRREILAQLEADGIRDDNRSLTLPALLRHIAVVSSAGAAGYGDFCDQLRRNDYGLAFRVQLFPAVMQGQNVEESVLAALAAIADEADRWDCVVIIRGGGATTDLADFDSYALAAAVAQMPLPVIVGIGHERDETVLDFVAHTRVKTPTAAAAFLIDHGAAQLARLDDLHDRITQHARLRVQNAKSRIDTLALRLATMPRHRLLDEHHRMALLNTRFTQSARFRVQNARIYLQHISPRLAQAATQYIQHAQLQVDALAARLAALDPVLQLRRGYSLTFAPDGSLLRSIAELRHGDRITTRLSDGTLTSLVTDNSP